MPKLTLHLSDSSASMNILSDDMITVGRLPDNTIQIDDASVSSHHAELVLSGGDYRLRDLNSTNGTRVNGQQIKEAQLRDGDRVRFGKIEGEYTSEIRSEVQPLPEAEHAAAKPAALSERPSGFTNASPFAKKKMKKDPVGNALIAFAVVSMLAFAGAVVTILMLKPPGQ